jgi:hypothetical protein
MDSTKAPCLLTFEAVRYWETLSAVSIRRLFPRRAEPLARESIRGWIRTLRHCAMVRAYRNWN